METADLTARLVALLGEGSAIQETYVAGLSAAEREAMGLSWRYNMPCSITWGRQSSPLLAVQCSPQLALFLSTSNSYLRDVLWGARSS